MLPRGIRRLFRLFRGHGDVEDDLDAEIAFHLAAKTDALVDAGISPEAARVEALRQFGDLGRVRRELAAIDHRDTERRLTADRFEAVWSDLRFAARGVARTPGFTAVVVLTLALGVGATAAMFGVVDRLLLRAPIGLTEPERLARLYIKGTEPDTRGADLRPYYLYQELGVFNGAEAAGSVAFYDDRTGPAILADAAGTRDAVASLVTGGFFQVLGARMVLGRPLLSADDSAGAPPAAVVSYALWKGRDGGSPSVVGSTIHVKGRAYTVVGVAPAGFSGVSPRTVDVWLPAHVAADDFFGPILHNPYVRSYAFGAVARLSPGADRAKAAAELTLAYRRGEAALPPGPFTLAGGTETVELGSIIPGRSRIELGRTGETLSLSLLAAAVAFIVCLIATANVANLLLLRALGRRRETGIRLALGVGRWRLVRPILAESLLLAAMAGAAAAWIASAGGELLRKLLTQDDWAAPVLDLRVFGFVAATTFVVGTLTGLVPAFVGGRLDALAALRAGVRLSGWTPSRMRAALMVGQVALTVVLLAGFGLFARSLLRAGQVDFGIDATHLLVASTARVSSAQQLVDVETLLARVRRLPGVRAAAAAQCSLPMWCYGVSSLTAEGVASLPNNTGEGGPFYSSAGAGYFDAVGVPLLRGRLFAPGEYVAPATVALVSDAMARHLWPAEDAIGKCLYIQTTPKKPPCARIVGIVGNVRQSVAGPPLMQYYVPLRSDVRFTELEIVVRTIGNPDRLVAPLASLLKTFVPGLPDNAVATIASRLDSDFHAWRLGTALFAMFAGLALLVAMVGVYSVVAFDAAQRRNEFGIRVALGARGWDLARLLFGQGLRYGAIGLLVGLILVVVAGRYVAPQLFHTSPRDPMVLAAVGLLLLTAAGIACAVPARSAVRADPRSALQTD